MAGLVFVEGETMCVEKIHCNAQSFREKPNPILSLHFHSFLSYPSATEVTSDAIKFSLTREFSIFSIFAFWIVEKPNEVF